MATEVLGELAGNKEAAFSVGYPGAAGCSGGLRASPAHQRSSQVHVNTHKDLLLLCTNYLL